MSSIPEDYINYKTTAAFNIENVPKVFLSHHNTKKGDAKIVGECAFPLTGPGVVDTIFTDIAVIDVSEAGLVVREKVPGLSFDELQSRTGTALYGAETCGDLVAPAVG